MVYIFLEETLPSVWVVTIPERFETIETREVAKIEGIGMIVGRWLRFEVIGGVYTSLPKAEIICNGTGQVVVLVNFYPVKFSLSPPRFSSIVGFLP